MGTNYYWRSNPCPACKHVAEEIHIGKSSAGWCFALQVFPDEPDKPQNLEDWKRLFKSSDGDIFDEYGREIGSVEMLDAIANRAWEKSIEDLLKEDPMNLYRGASLQQFLDQNQAELGPNNLLRSRIDGRHCIGHGEGTWDLIASDFS